jgi:hypothetical protein
MSDPLKKVEQAFYVRNKEFPFGLKGRLDLISPENNIVVDIKTTSKPLTKHYIKKSIYEYKYGLQELTYMILCNQNGIHVNDMIFIFVETKEPFSCVSVGIDNPKISNEAMEDFTQANALFSSCMSHNSWPDLSQSQILI